MVSISVCGLLTLTGCSGGADSSITDEPSEHVHQLSYIPESQATCKAEGNTAYWACDCGSFFLDEAGTEEVAETDVKVAKTAHVLTNVKGIEPTCSSKGRREYWSCLVCKTNYADEACTEELKMSQLLLDKGNHELTHHEEISIDDRGNRVMEHWTCSSCDGYFADAAGATQITQADTILFSALSIPDFVVEVPVGRDPVVLQLPDTQIIDAAQARPGRTGVEYNYWATDQIEERCYDFLTEVITATNPDFIILTGDVIYGEFDDSGTALVSLINFMDGFEIPWSPVFGNHDNESTKGVDWQCEQLENSPYCYFEQKELTGNGNYSVAIAQGGEIKRVFYMLDSNGCGNASAESKANGHTSTVPGFAQDQINWYTSQINTLKEYVPDVKISFAYHIQQAIFGEAYAKYGFNQANAYQDINLDTMEGVAEGVKFDDTTNAWKVTAGTQGKLYINTALMRGKTTFTFSVYVPSTSTKKLGGYGEFAIRVKPNDSEPALDGKAEGYIDFDSSASDSALKLEFGKWQTFTVDITGLDATCTEFAFNIASGNTLYIKDVTLS